MPRRSGATVGSSRVRTPVPAVNVCLADLMVSASPAFRPEGPRLLKGKELISFSRGHFLAYNIRSE